MVKYDVIIIGAGAAGMFAAMKAFQRNLRVAVLDMGDVPLRKVAISGGGRCNFTNSAANYNRYFGNNPNFVRSALAQFSPENMLDWIQSHKIDTIQKAPGQYFCATGANSIIDALMYETRNVKTHMNQYVLSVTKQNDIFIISTKSDIFSAKSVIIATGGTSYSNLGVSDIGMKIAHLFGHKIIPIRPALCSIITKFFSSELAGISVPVCITIGKTKIYDDMMFTHNGIGGPAVYRASVRDVPDSININLMPEINVRTMLTQERQINGRHSVTTCLSAYMPSRIAKWIIGNADKNIADLTNAEMIQITNKISDIRIPKSDIKLNTLNTAEIMRGGIATDNISSKTMESKLCPGLFFAGEVLDIAGDLGGFNLQWAWSSGFVAGNNA